MAKSVHLYKLIHDYNPSIKLNVLKTIIKGFGFKKITYIFSTNGVISFIEIDKSEVGSLISQWESDNCNSAIVKQNGVIRKYCEGFKFANVFICQEFIPYAKELVAVWTPTKITFKKKSKNLPISELAKTTKVLKEIIDQEIFKINCKLNKLNICFLYFSEKFHCIGIELYSCSKILASPKLNLKSINSIPFVLKTPESHKNKSLTLSTKTTEKTIRTEKIIKKHVSTPMSSGIKKIKSEENLFRRSQIFDTNILPKKKNSVDNFGKCMNDLKQLTNQMKTSFLHDQHNFDFHHEIRKNLVSIFQRPRFVTQPQTMPKELNITEISAQSAQNLIKASCKSLSELSKIK